MAAVQEQDDSLVQASQQNLTAAQDYSASHTDVPYYVIGGIGALLLLLILIVIVKTARS